MKNTLTLILPDIHHRIELAEKIIKAVDPDQTVMIGDYFDDWNDTPEMVKNTTEWIEYSVNKPDRILCFGNHDLMYAFANRSFQCSGYEDWKYYIIHDTLDGKKVWDKFKYYYILDNTWFISHAGLHKFNLPQSISDLYLDRSLFLNKISTYLDEEIIKGHRNESWIFRAGYSRGGNQRVGGITWCDFDREFNPIRGLNSICGHTPDSMVRWANLSENDPKVKFIRDVDFSPSIKDINNPQNSFNLCLDTNTGHYATWNGKKLTVHWIGDL